MVLEAIKYGSGRLEILNQLLLPHKVTYDSIDSTEAAWHAIRSMRVRGAPAIAMVGALGLAAELQGPTFKRSGCNLRENTLHVIASKLDYLVTSRPTAVNLKNAAENLKTLVLAEASRPQATGDTIIRVYVNAAEEMLSVDRADNRKLGDHGARWLLHNARTNTSGPISVLTHCNTGSLATAGYGTALGVIRSLHRVESLKRAFFTETRPYNQGSRLTAFELVHDDIPATLITDSMACALMHLKKSSENIAGVVVGADRIASNGDTANKIGTYALAIAAKHHEVKFVVAAPCSTIDIGTRRGEAIRIEERPAMEMTSIGGPKVRQGLKGNVEVDADAPAERVSIAAAAIEVWNPAFDVTPAALVDAIVTEKGVIEKAAGEDVFDIRGFLQGSKANDRANGASV